MKIIDKTKKETYKEEYASEIKEGTVFDTSSLYGTGPFLRSYQTIIALGEPDLIWDLNDNKFLIEDYQELKVELHIIERK